MSREIHSHKVNGLNEVLKIEAVDSPGSGGANHLMRPNPSKEGWYWAKWLRPSPTTHEKEEMAFPLDWEIVEVWMNHFRDDSHEKFAVSVPGVRETQWPEDFEWGERIPDLGVS